MTKYNCGRIIGSLVYRAQGYKRLTEEVTMSSKFYVSDKTSKNSIYCLVAQNVVARNILAERNQTLPMGSLVIIEQPSTNFNWLEVEVKLIDYEKKTNIPEEIVFLCPSDHLIQVDKETWNLIAAVSSPVEKVKIARNPNLCSQLRDIDVGSIVEVLPSSVGIVTFKGSIEELGPGTYFGVELLDEEDGKQDEMVNRQVYSAERLRLISDHDKKLNGKTNSATNNDLNAYNDQGYTYSNMKKLDKKCEGTKLMNVNRLKPGDRVIWFSETGEQKGSICWCSPVDNTARVHLGDSICKNVNCERLQTNTLPVRDLIAEDEFFRKKVKSMPQIREKFSNSVTVNEVKTGDLLGIDQVDDSSLYFSYNVSKDLQEDRKPNKIERQFTNDFCKLESTARTTRDQDPLLNSEDLGVGSVVEVSIAGEAHYGVIKWIGFVKFENCQSRLEVAGVEIEEENPSCTDGYLRGIKHFDCAPQRGFFCLLSHCKKDSRFQDLSYSNVNETRTPTDFGCAVIPGIVEPINQVESIHVLCGKYKGIQGHNNSCYLDATLFSMFTFTSVFDSLLLRPPNKSDITAYEEVQRVLREEIVNPLRKNLFVQADRVMKLRTLLDNLTSVTGLTCEEKDPEEFLTSLVAQVLKAEPFLKLSSGHEAYYYQLFVEKDERLVLPTVQQLFEQSLITSDIKLKEVPSCLIIQMPRFGKAYKMYPRILPSQILDVTDVIENSPRQCTVCGELAEYECKDCFKHYYNGSQYFSSCEQCVKTVHSHEERLNHKWNRIVVPDEYGMHHGNAVPRQYMELFAVLCIETSHYVAFVKCGMGPDTPWCFFDSMADRKGGLNGYNIPEMVLCPDLPMWLSDTGAQSFSEMKDDRHLPSYAKRLLCDAYMCMYQSTDVMMYR